MLPSRRRGGLRLFLALLAREIDQPIDDERNIGQSTRDAAAAIVLEVGMVPMTTLKSESVE